MDIAGNRDIPVNKDNTSSQVSAAAESIAAAPAFAFAFAPAASCSGVIIPFGEFCASVRRKSKSSSVIDGTSIVSAPLSGGESAGVDEPTLAVPTAVTLPSITPAPFWEISPLQLPPPLACIPPLILGAPLIFRSQSVTTPVPKAGSSCVSSSKVAVMSASALLVPSPVTVNWYGVLEKSAEVTEKENPAGAL
ncbi:MAG: hypothetical protein U5J62_00105 [Desulfurivibrio sp.]|nr:hypothetical protein [Desulfurivibrio sp.]